jgi:pyrroloquinoline-quinone synthase
MTTQEFISQLDARIAKYDLLCHPFYQAWSAGKLTRDDLREYAREYFHHVDAFPAYLEEFAARLPQGHLRRAVLANRDEEAGNDGSRAHSELWLDFVEGMGGSRTSGAAQTNGMKDLMSSFHTVAREGAPEEALAAFYAYESQVPRVATEKARGLRDMYHADAKTCGYFTLHTTADIYHSNVWRNQLERLVEEGSPAAEQRALAAAENAAKALWNALDGIDAVRTAKAA